MLLSFRFICLDLAKFSVICIRYFFHNIFHYHLQLNSLLIETPVSIGILYIKVCFRRCYCLIKFFDIPYHLIAKGVLRMPLRWIFRMFCQFNSSFSICSTITIITGTLSADATQPTICISARGS